MSVIYKRHTEIVNIRVYLQFQSTFYIIYMIFQSEVLKARIRKPYTLTKTRTKSNRHMKIYISKHDIWRPMLC